MIKLTVWLTSVSGDKRIAGEIVVGDPDPQGRLNSQFRYTQDYLDYPTAFSLDPIHLPLSREIFDGERPYSGVHGVFEDSFPDDWGRRILANRYNLSREKQRVPYLLSFLGGQGLGALGYSLDNNPPQVGKEVDGTHLHELQMQAAKFENDSTSVGEGFRLLFQAGSSPGGARPKALIVNQGKKYLAKFSSVNDRFDVVALESATMELARKSGIDAAPSELVELGEKKVLLVERFDVNKGGGRNHLISMQTLLKAEGYYNLAYRDLCGILRRISVDPQSDLKKLFRQMVFNVIIGNTDDHLKNFSMLHDEEGWRLSPAYDLVPNIGQNQEHVLRIGLYPYITKQEDLVGEAKWFGIKKRSKVEEIVEEITTAMQGYRTAFTQNSVPEKDIDIIDRDISHRMEKLSL